METLLKLSVKSRLAGEKESLIKLGTPIREKLYAAIGKKIYSYLITGFVVKKMFRSQLFLRYLHLLNITCYTG